MSLLERRTVPLWIGNEAVLSETTFQVINSATGESVTAHGATPELVQKAIDSSYRAFGTWKRTSPWRRRELLNRAANLLRERRDEVAAILRASRAARDDVETPIDDFMIQQINIQTSIDLLEELAGQIMQTTGAVVQPSKQADDMLAMVFREPLGVQVGIAPWNASLLLGMRAVATPIACGNTAILKASEKTPMAHHFIGRLFHDAGFPAGVLNVVQHSREDAVPVVDALVSDDRVRKVNFTGSTAVGKIVAANAARHCKPVLLELGGKSAQLVLADADLDKAAQAAAIGAFTHHGQVCMSTERILVSESVLGPFSEKLAASSAQVSASVRPGASVEHSSQVAALLEDALAKGARILGGGEGVRQDGPFLTPRILVNVTPAMKIWHTETFAPIALLIPFGTVDEAVALANGTAYGLSASVFTANVPLAIEIGRRLESGSVHINSMTIHDEAHMPHGGVKESGWGRFGVPWGFAEFTQLKTITISDTHLAG
ncbi:vanillin dehydrogenase [Trichoderma cornu-damae]|uniref:Vanillin dehydrogenase n=1 Tax=Trichoderma cornu-damae TaxID=654480 RepID=A0A9P8QM25_9HYPO|nr:vanillin dehydrogenase [Trichoderma cornu-damae]